MQDVRDALAAGKTVTISQRSVTVANWTGTGYIITNPNTGSGSYLIGGGADGGFVGLLDDVKIQGQFKLGAILSFMEKIPIKFALGAFGQLFTVLALAYTIFSECGFNTESASLLLVALLMSVAIALVIFLLFPLGGFALSLIAGYFENQYLKYMIEEGC